jgi:DNA mismatch repair protein MutL
VIEAALHEVLDMMACKAAVKAGDRLSDAELAELLALRERVERSSNCPHGRPTSIRMSVAELYRRFGRT